MEKVRPYTGREAGLGQKVRPYTVEKLAGPEGERNTVEKPAWAVQKLEHQK